MVCLIVHMEKVLPRAVMDISFWIFGYGISTELFQGSILCTLHEWGDWTIEYHASRDDINLSDPVKSRSVFGWRHH